MSLKKIFRLLLAIQIALGVGLAILAVALYITQNNLSKSQRVHFQSYLLADELRQSSDDLTRLAWSYVATGNEEYERQYWEVLSIRNGKRPRPDGKAISLTELMLKEGFTDAELAKLNISHKYSDELVKIEEIAMHAVKGFFADEAGNFTIRKTPDRELAIKLMNDEAYHENKVKIMKPIDEFFTMFEAQTNREVAKNEQRSMILLFSLGALVIIIIGMFGFSFVIIQRRISELLEAEETLQKLSLAIYNSQEIVFLTDKEGIITYINPEFTKVYGYTAEEVVGVTTPRILKSGFLKREDNKLFWDALLNKQNITKTEYFNKCKNGKLLEIEASASPIVNKNGDIIGFLALQRDITHRKRSELERQVLYEITHGVTTTSNLNELLNLIRQSLAKVVYAENCFIALYDQKTKLFGFPFWVDKYDTAPEPFAMYKSCTAYIFKTGKPLLLTQKLFDNLVEKNEVELVGTNSPSWIGIPLQTPEKTIGVLVLQHYEEENVYSEKDVQFLDSVGSQIALAIERKRTEEEIKKRNEELSKINAEKDKFFSIIAHDLKSPFLGFLGLTQIMAEDISSFSADELTKLAVEMNQNANNLFTLLKNLLEWAQMQNGSMSFEPKEISLSDMIAKNVATVEERSEQKGILIINKVIEPITACVDGNMINSVLLNLLSNAVKFTRRDGTITIQTSKIKEDEIEISVKDPGVGMPKSIVEKLFKVGEKIGSKGTEGELSTGLGLLLCKEFVEKNGGKICAESEEGKGSTFYFTVPLKN